VSVAAPEFIAAIETDSPVFGVVSEAVQNTSKIAVFGDSPLGHGFLNFWSKMTAKSLISYGY